MLQAKNCHILGQKMTVISFIFISIHFLNRLLDLHFVENLSINCESLDK